MKVDALKLVKLRNHFYRDNFRRLALVLLLSLILNVVLAVSLIYKYQEVPKIIYFATSQSGKLIYLQPLQTPILSNAAIVAWVNSTIPKIYNIDFLNYRQQMADIQKYFTRYGWQEFLLAFSPTLKHVQTDQLVATSAPANVPYVISQGLMNGVYSWRVQVPLLITFQKGSQQQQQQVVWTLLVQRVNNLYTDQLLGISQVIQTIQNS